MCINGIFESVLITGHQIGTLGQSLVSDTNVPGTLLHRWLIINSNVKPFIVKRGSSVLLLRLLYEMCKHDPAESVSLNPNHDLSRNHLFLVTIRTEPEANRVPATETHEAKDSFLQTVKGSVKLLWDLEGEPV